MPLDLVAKIERNRIYQKRYRERCAHCNYSRGDKLISEWTWKEAA